MTGGEQDKGSENQKGVKRTGDKSRRIITAEKALIYGRREANGQLSTAELAALMIAMLECKDRRAKDAAIRSFVEGIAMEDPKVRGAIDSYLDRVGRRMRLASIVEVTGTRKT